jgi:UDP-glucose 4-epimerase
MKKKIIVTGGAGFIGSHTVVELHLAGYSPVIVDDFSNSDEYILEGLRELTGIDIPVYRFDFGDRERLQRVFEEEQPDGVIHFAAFKAVGESVEKPLMYYRNNVASLITLLEVMKAGKVSNLVFSSSCTVYGQPDHNPVTEQTELRPASSPYGTTKQIGEQIIRDQCAAHPQTRAVMLRYFNPIGAHPSGLIGELPFGVPNNLVPYITQTAAGLRNKLTVFGSDYTTPDGTCIRDFIHVVDIAKAHVSALRWLDGQEAVCDVFNLGCGRGNSVLEVIHAFVEASGQTVPYELGPRRPGDIEQIWADVTRANRELGWKALIDLKTSMKDAWNWQLKLQEVQIGPKAV